ncbi:hypothetical protein BU26DRAFT_210110 [Trematosphaeria pertusa]|uniref:Uncharacterized protein n=1 Tax=Trematosphaeria pertusa TaxID=390896 RepID=A0A6A6IUG3_9PLEO|nr:uncharacterized protein BU26DRAFT_210110 [Trematosphaeria pertusa]KAF2252813.1 hypothetical protein BU26DRAFT_210110 [Trematosphaeria pertusa]
MASSGFSSVRDPAPVRQVSLIEATCISSPSSHSLLTVTMNPATAKLALKLQLDDIDVVLKSLPTSSSDIRAKNEVAAFRALRNELVIK